MFSLRFCYFRHGIILFCCDEAVSMTGFRSLNGHSYSHYDEIGENDVNILFLPTRNVFGEGSVQEAGVLAKTLNVKKY